MEHKCRKYPLPPIEWMRERMWFDPDLGDIFCRETGRSLKIVGLSSRPAGDMRARIQVWYNGYSTTISFSQVAFALMEGRWSDYQIDHKDNNPLNNVWTNLREATQSNNGSRRVTWAVSGYKGVSLTSSGKYKARVWNPHDRKYEHRGYHKTAAEAAEAVKVRHIELRGKWSSFATEGQFA